jgi:hypothetical protein
MPLDRESLYKNVDRWQKALLFKEGFGEAKA